MSRGEYSKQHGKRSKTRKKKNRKVSHDFHSQTPNDVVPNVHQNERMNNQLKVVSRNQVQMPPTQPKLPKRTKPSYKPPRGMKSIPPLKVEILPGRNPGSRARIDGSEYSRKSSGVTQSDGRIYNLYNQSIMCNRCKKKHYLKITTDNKLPPLAFVTDCSGCGFEDLKDKPRKYQKYQHSNGGNSKRTIITNMRQINQSRNQNPEKQQRTVVSSPRNVSNKYHDYPNTTTDSIVLPRIGSIIINDGKAIVIVDNLRNTGLLPCSATLKHSDDVRVHFRFDAFVHNSVVILDLPSFRQPKEGIYHLTVGIGGCEIHGRYNLQCRVKAIPYTYNTCYEYIWNSYSTTDKSKFTMNTKTKHQSSRVPESSFVQPQLYEPQTVEKFPPFPSTSTELPYRSLFEKPQPTLLSTFRQEPPRKKRKRCFPTRNNLSIRNLPNNSSPFNL